MTKTQRNWFLLASVAVILLLIYSLRSILGPFFVAAFLAYLGNPFVELLRRFKLSRTAAATIVFIIIMLAIFSFIFFLVPLLSREISQFINQLPATITWLQQNALPWVNEHLNLNQTFAIDDLKSLLSQHLQTAGSIAASIWKVLASSGIVFIGWIAKLLLIPVVLFYLLRDWDIVWHNFQELLPRHVEAKVTQLARECNEVLGAFLRGQMLVILCLIVIYSLGLYIAGINFALLLGSIAAILTIVPYLGVIIGVIMASIAAGVQYHDWTHVFYVLIVFAVGHVAENMVLTPWLVGNKIGLHPLAVIFAILVGGHIFGFVGVLLALPVAAIIMVLLRHFKEYYLQSPLYG